MLKLLRRSVPAGWVISVIEVESQCLAEIRQRVYIVGHTEVHPEEHKVDDIVTMFPTITLEDILLMHKVPNQRPEPVLTKKQQTNLRNYTMHVESS